MISRELGTEGNYGRIYPEWKSQNSGDLRSSQAAYSAGYTLCVKYEKPSGYMKKGLIRGDYARTVFSVMMGN
jgi:hypothetical protein